MPTFDHLCVEDTQKLELLFFSYAIQSYRFIVAAAHKDVTLPVHAGHREGVTGKGLDVRKGILLEFKDLALLVFGTCDNVCQEFITINLTALRVRARTPYLTVLLERSEFRIVFFL